MTTDMLRMGTCTNITHKLELRVLENTTFILTYTFTVHLKIN